MIQNDKNFEDDSVLLFLIHPQSNPAREQVQFFHNLIANLFEKINSPCKQEIPEVKVKRQYLTQYLPSITDITSLL